jgi:phasin family protein
MNSDPNNPFADLLATHKKNIEALTQANQIAISGLQAVASRQMEFVQKALAEAAAFAQLSGQPQDLGEAVTRSIAEMRELSDILQKSGREAVDVVNQRIAQSLAELKPG